MKPSVVDLGHGFWNLRGRFRLGGVVDIGTHASLVRRQSGRYVLLDACPLAPEVKELIDRETNGGDALEAVLHLHPFHSVFVGPLHEAYPKAKLYGTARHKKLQPDLPWQAERTEDPALHALFAEDLDFMVPSGVDFIPENENLHFSSVLAFHTPSKTLHVDDTLNYVRMPWPVSVFKQDALGFHPSLAKVLERRAGAVRDFRAWVSKLVERSRSIDNLCAAHTSFLAGQSGGEPLAARIEVAAKAIQGKLDAHEQRFG